MRLSNLLLSTLPRAFVTRKVVSMEPLKSSSILSTPLVARKLQANTPNEALPSDGFSANQSAELGLMQPVQISPETSSGLPRPMTAAEKADFHQWFPVLDVEKSQVTAEATPRYNCISWTTGNTKSWDWPPSMFPKESPVGAFEHYYTSRGFSKVSAEDAAKLGKETELVAYWEDPNGPTHGSVSGPSHGERWESKCGQAARITHEQNELESDVYGAIKGFWIKTGPATVESAPVDAEALKRVQSKLESRLGSADPAEREQFNSLYADWQQSRNSPKVQMSSNPADYCSGAAYSKLAKLGPEALPFIVDKMLQGDHFCQYLAASVTQPKEDFRLLGAETPTLAAKNVACSEQDKAQQVMEQWLNSSY